jgi:hypothetical protein
MPCCINAVLLLQRPCFAALALPPIHSVWLKRVTVSMKPHSLALAAVLPAALALPANTPAGLKYTRRQYATDRAQAVVDVFRTSWDGYYEYAFPNDELKPVTNGFSNSR